MTLRLFAALPVPDDIAARLEALQRDVPGAAWRPLETLHITLRFFGEIDEATARDLDDELGLIEVAPFELRLKGAGSFGGHEPRALWVGVESPPPLARLAERCERAARRTGLPPEKRSFTPHVTLAYSRGLTPENAALFLERIGGFQSEPFWADHFLMFSSWPTKTGSRYVEEAVYPLTGRPEGDKSGKKT
jgi:RNA 2',3'-cyclic 3'-phosphodiesterase